MWAAAHKKVCAELGVCTHTSTRMVTFWNLKSSEIRDSFCYYCKKQIICKAFCIEVHIAEAACIKMQYFQIACAAQKANQLEDLNKTQPNSFT
jgi:hypothetical protein